MTKHEIADSDDDEWSFGSYHFILEVRSCKTDETEKMETNCNNRWSSNTSVHFCGNRFNVAKIDTDLSVYGNHTYNYSIPTLRNSRKVPYS